MLRIFDHGIRLCDGLHRREWLRLGGIGLGGLQLGALNAARNSLASSAATAHRRAFGRAKSVIVFGLVGGPPQHETWDPKPLAPSDIRGEFGTIETRTPNLRVGELMPRTALLTDKIAVLRAVVTNDNAHSSSGYQMLTGVPHQPLNQESAVARPPNLAPSMGALLRAVRSRPGELPAAMTIPEHIWNDGNFPWPGQDAGSLGPRFHPWLLHCDPSSPDFSLPGLQLPQDIPPIRFDERHSLLDQLNTSFAAWDQSRVADRLRGESRVAFDLIASSNARRAFQLSAESDSMRDRYGRSRFAQSVLLARRLVEAGVSLVQINWTRIKDQPNQGGWDTHAKHNESLKSLLMPMMDQCFSALLEDLEQRGLLDETLVVWFGEFGRTPRFNANAGRDHWGRVFSLALAGGGIRGGVVHGSSDKHAAEPVDGMVQPRDLIATLFHCLGIPADTVVTDREGRSVPVVHGEVIEAIL
jgi:hypothetical protein